MKILRRDRRTHLRIFLHAIADDAEDFALVTWNARIDERFVRTFLLGETGDIALHFLDRAVKLTVIDESIDVLNLLGELKERGLGVLFITHDLSLGNYISDRTLILRHGRIAELGATQKVFGDPRHPYTRALLASVPKLHRKWSEDAGALAAEMPEFDPLAVETLVQVDDDHFVAQAVS